MARFEVNDPNAKVVLGYLIVNKGHGGAGEEFTVSALTFVATKAVVVGFLI